MRREKRNRLASIIIIALTVIIASSLNAQTFTEDMTAIADVIVDMDGSGDYTTVKEAIASIPDDNDTWKIIFIKNGTYYEKIILGYKKTKVILVGEHVDSTIITYNDNAGIYKDTLGNGHTFSTYTFRADADDFQAYNISFRNNAMETGAVGDAQAVSFHSNGDRQILYHCRILGEQDTYFDGFRTRRYFKDCFIEGTIDFIFGFGVTLFDSCQIHSLTGSEITAASTPQYYEFGQVFRYCRLTASPNVNSTSLGRPWFDWANTIFFECWEPAALRPAGWSTWSGREATCIYREYNCSGPGSDTLQRVDFGKQLDPSKASRYVTDTILAASNFPSDLGYDVDTNELFYVRRRFEASGYPERADTIIYAGRETLPTYPDDNWSPEFNSTVHDLVNEYFVPFMDSVNGEISIDNIYWNNNPIPGFHKDTLYYVVELDDTVTIVPEITVAGTGVYSSVQYPGSIPGEAVVTTLSRDKANGNIYKVYFSQDSAYWNADLEFIIINRKDTVNITPGIYEYDVLVTGGETKVRTVTVKTIISGLSYVREDPVEYPGVLNIYVTALDGQTMSNYNFNVSLAVDLFNVETNSNDIYVVNPAKDYLQFYYRGNKIINSEIKVFDLNGRMLYAEKINSMMQGLNETGINVSGLDNGVYLYSIEAGNEIYTGKFVLAK